MEKSKRAWIDNTLVIIAVLALFVSFLPGAAVRATLFGWWPEMAVFFVPVVLVLIFGWCLRPTPDPERGDLGYKVLFAETRTKFYRRCLYPLGVLTAVGMIYNAVYGFAAIQKFASSNPKIPVGPLPAALVLSNALRSGVALSWALLLITGICAYRYYRWSNEVKKLAKISEPFCRVCGYSFSGNTSETVKCSECGASIVAN